jgi:lipopolysaccharide biosynthesis glycosyltransferase
MKVAIIFWGTGEYVNFLPEWYERIEKYFLPTVEKSYFVFSDGELEGSLENIKLINIPHYGFPETFHKTFEELLKIKDMVSDYDWIVSIDADLYVQKKITTEEFFDISKKYFGVHHPCHYLKMPPHDKKPGSYDINPLSNAFIDDSIMDMDIYYQGCLWGGKIPYVFDMMEKIDEWTKEDVSKNSVGRFYEESYLNKWFLTHREDVNTLASDYAYPEMFKQYCKFTNKMMHLHKNNKSLGNNQW